MTPISIRRAHRPDFKGLIRLIRELAAFEKLEPPDADAEARLLEFGFGETPRFEAWLAFVQESAGPVGYAITFETFSSFLARPTLYLEDIFVLPESRKLGIGKALLRHCVGLAQQRACGRMEWTCLDWNCDAQGFYDAIGARWLAEWRLYRLTHDHFDSAAEQLERVRN